ncbi:hypothetical protein ACF3NG_08525 [Aerococcaceae bacterium WGS1372]
MPTKRKQVRERLNDVLTLLDKKRLSKKIRILTDEEKINCYHPLSVKVRKQWIIK